MTIRQLVQWQAFWTIEPFGDDWRRTARGAMTAAAGFGARPAPDAEDRFLPSYREKPQTIEQMKAELAKIPQFAKQMQERG